ncbi:hypothetical protein PENTCL1PPCAC_8334, partial [Pristionchus entomophagus]
MSKLLGATSVLVLAALGVAIASLVFNILIFNQVNTSDSPDPTTPPPTTPLVPSTSSLPPTACPTPAEETTPEIPDPVTEAPNNNGGECPTTDEVSKDPMWKEAANRILATADLSVDPCDDFYQFSCGKYLQNTDLDGQSRKGTYDEAQYEINLGLADYFDSFWMASLLPSNTEQYQKNFLDICVKDALKDQTDPAVRKAKWVDLAKDMNIELGFPLFGGKGWAKDTADIFSTMGMMERLYTGGPLITSMVTSDFKDNNTNALYLNQPALHFARDY